jgi:hypothetical protein
MDMFNRVQLLVCGYPALQAYLPMHPTMASLLAALLLLWWLLVLLPRIH